MEREHKYLNGYFEREGLEKDFFKIGLLRPDQHAALSYAYGFHEGVHRLTPPKRVLSIGCGQGVIEDWLHDRRVSVVATDIADNRIKKNTFEFIKGTMDDVTYEDFDVVILCEAIEHIPEDEFERNWQKIVTMLKKTKGLFIVTNWVHFHPIYPDSSGWDHVREINNELYDRLASHGMQVVRNGSHLVIKFI